MTDAPAASAAGPFRSGRDRARKFLVVVDKTAECHVAVRFATRRAQHTSGRVTLFCVVEHDDFQQWRGVEEIMKDEAHQEAENLIYEAAKVVNDLAGIIPELVIMDGKQTDCLAELIKSDADISILVLAAGTGKEGPGPLVSAFAGRADANLIPVTIVPGGLSYDEIDRLA
ncbi:MAG: universal stress protein [Alphaproteobacteria bacterium]|nr:universal stress protein [Alphaproteobacteria bacterium]